MMAFGAAPFYKVMSNDGEWEGERKGEVYTFDKTKVGGYNVTIRPNADYNSLWMRIEISD